jgi:subtilisin family serine protease
MNDSAQGGVLKVLFTGIAALAGLVCLSGVTVSPLPEKLDPMLSHEIDAEARAASGLSGLLAAFREKPTRNLLISASGDPALAAKMADLGSEVVETAPGYFAGKVPVESIRYISNWPTVRFMEAGRKGRRMLNLSRPAVMADIVQNGSGAGLSSTPYTGAGTFVGILDTGLSAAHRDFYDNGSLSLPRATYLGASATTDPDGHGTHVSGIAAGNGFSSRGTYTGMAPASRILLYQTSFDTTDILSGIGQILAAAGSSPVSVNLSLGLMGGSHDGTSLFESAVNALATGSPGSKRLITVAAGNEGDMREHFQTTIPALGGTSSVDVRISSDSYYATASIDFWAAGSAVAARSNEYDTYTVSVTGPGVNVTAASGQTVTSSGGNLTIYNRVDTSVPNGATHISVIPAASLAGQTITIRFVRSRAGGNGLIDGYLDSLSTTEGFYPATAAGSIIEPANGDNVVGVGAFVTRTTPSYWGSTGSLVSFSSQGPTRDRRIKPDLTAPGANIYSARSRNASFSASEIVTANDNYAIMSGTSMATPHITGIAALIWESNPTLTGAQMRERLRRNAVPVGSPPNSIWGYGKADALASITSTVASFTVPSIVPTGSPTTLDASGSSGAFGAGIDYAWSILSGPTGSSATIPASGSSVAFTPDLPGDYLVSLTTTQSTPSGTTPATTTRTIHANRLPTTPIISGPSASGNTSPVAFSGASTDPEGASLSWNWVLVSRPSFSAAAIVPGTGNEATLSPDVLGSYVVGLRASDGLDNSVLGVFTFTLGPPAPPASTAAPASSGHGGCSLGDGTANDGVDAPLLLLASLALLRLVRNRRRIPS